MKQPSVISILDCVKADGRVKVNAEMLHAHWPSACLPDVNTQDHFSADVVLAFADDDNQLLEYMPLILELHALKIPVVLACNNLGKLAETIHSLRVVQIAPDASPSSIAGIVFGVLQRNEQITNLQGQVDLVRRMHTSLQSHLVQLQEELETASLVQREFMSSGVRSVTGAKFSTLWKPAGVVSGDMYDITQLDETHVGFFLVDAIGHDISAAMLSMMLTRILASNRIDLQTGEFIEPKAMMQLLNTALLQRSGEHARFATAAYGILNCKTSQLVFAGGGHPPALITHQNQPPRLLNSDGPLLGVFKDAQFEQSTVDLVAGDTLLLYSDGFEQALWNDGQTHPTLPGYLQAMQTFCHREDENVIHGIQAYLNHSSVIKADDDLTMICLNVEPQPACLQVAA